MKQELTPYRPARLSVELSSLDAGNFPAVNTTLVRKFAPSLYLLGVFLRTAAP
jgi:hypothetical protein